MKILGKITAKMVDKLDDEILADSSSGNILKRRMDIWKNVYGNFIGENLRFIILHRLNKQQLIKAYKLLYELQASYRSNDTNT